MHKTNKPYFISTEICVVEFLIRFMVIPFPDNEFNRLSIFSIQNYHHYGLIGTDVLIFMKYSSLYIAHFAIATSLLTLAEYC